MAARDDLTFCGEASGDVPPFLPLPDMIQIPSKPCDFQKAALPAGGGGYKLSLITPHNESLL